MHLSTICCTSESIFHFCSTNKMNNFPFRVLQDILLNLFGFPQSSFFFPTFHTNPFYFTLYQLQTMNSQLCRKNFRISFSLPIILSRCVIASSKSRFSNHCTENTRSSYEKHKTIKRKENSTQMHSFIQHSTLNSFKSYAIHISKLIM